MSCCPAYYLTRTKNLRLGDRCYVVLADCWWYIFKEQTWRQLGWETFAGASQSKWRSKHQYLLKISISKSNPSNPSLQWSSIAVTMTGFKQARSRDKVEDLQQSRKMFISKQDMRSQFSVASNKIRVSDALNRCLSSGWPLSFILSWHHLGCQDYTSIS